MKDLSLFMTFFGGVPNITSAVATSPPLIQRVGTETTLNDRNVKVVLRRECRKGDIVVANIRKSM